MIKYTHYYAEGRFISCSGSEFISIINPTTEQCIGKLSICSKEDLNRAVESANRAFSTWSLSSLNERRAALGRLLTAIESRTDAFAEVLALEMGCPITLGKTMQVSMPIRNIKHTMEGLDQIQWVEQIGNATVESIPVGVLGAITPWNFPLHQIIAKVAGAIAAGCTIVLKPSEQVPGVGKLFMEAVEEMQLPPGVINIVWGGAELGASLVMHPLIDQISFTGSTAVGRQVMASASTTLKRVKLELGGNSAAVLLPDADLDAALSVVVKMSMGNSGQMCVSQSRLIVPSHLSGQVINRLKALLTDWNLGDPIDPKTRLGPVATQAQFNNINKMLEDAQAQGATLYNTKGRTAGFQQGWFCAPTIISDVHTDMAIAQEEVFGPVLSVITYENEAEALKIVNGTNYGLSGAVWSNSSERALTFARQIRTGQVIINGADQNLATPFGGWKNSGFGRENGRFGIQDCLDSRSISMP